jgi:four helix bundle protein
MMKAYWLTVQKYGEGKRRDMNGWGAKRFRDLPEWRKAMSLVTETYRITRIFPADERQGPVRQIRRCAGAIPGNMGEGCVRKAANDYSRFLRISIGSLLNARVNIIALNLEYS